MENGPSKIEPSQVQAGQKRKIVRHWKHGVRTLWWLAMLPIVFVAIAGILLIEQEVRAPSWVKSRLLDRAQPVLGGGDLSFDDIFVVVGKDLHPRVRMAGVKLTDAEQAVLARIDQVTGLLSPRGLLFEQRALLQNVEVSGARLDLQRDADGQVVLSFGDAQAAVAEAPSLVEVLDIIDAALSRPEWEALETISASELTLHYSDARADANWIARSEVLELDLAGAAHELEAAFAVQNLSGLPEARVEVTFHSPKDDRSADLSLEVVDVPATDIALQSPALTWLQVVDAPVSFRLDGPVTAEGELGTVSASLNAGPGTIRMIGETAATPFDEAFVAMTYDAGQTQVDIGTLSIRSPQLTLAGRGQVLGKDLKDGLPQTLVAQMELHNLEGTFPNQFEEKLSLSGAFLDARMRFDPLRLDVGQITITDPATPLTVSGHIEETDAGIEVALDAHAPALDRDTILGFWPVDQKPKTRSWFDKNLLAGQVRDANAALRIRPGLAPIWSLGFEFADTQLRIAGETPTIDAAAGQASFEAGAFALTVHDGHIRAAEGGLIDVAGTTLVIPEFQVKGSPLYVNWQSASSITAALSVLGDSPVDLLNRIQKPANAADGRAKVAGVIWFPRMNPLRPDVISYDMNAELSRVSSTEFIPDRSLQASRLQVAVTNEAVTIEGSARVDGVPVSGVYRKPIGRAGSSLRAAVELSAESLAAFDIGLPPGTVSGRGVGDLTVTFPEGAAPGFELTSNLAGVRLAVPPVGWSMSADTTGELRIAGRLGAQPRIDDLAVSGGGLNARGSVTLNGAGGLEAARFSTLQIGDWFNAPLALLGRGPGRPPSVQISGGALDLRRARFGPGQGDGGPVEIALDRLQIAQGIALTNFRGSFSGTGGFNGNFRGNLNGGTALRGTVVPQNGRSAVRVVSDDAGGILRAAGFLQGGSGGSFDLTLSPLGGEGTFDGALAVRGLRVRDAPAMASLLDAISVVGLLQQLDGQGLAFDEVDARFVLSPDQLVVRQASAVGPGLGISVDGIYTLASKQLDFQGVISPFYLLNGIGSVLTRKGEGLIGFNFNVTGPSSAANVSVNPLSALTPGMFREIFRRPPPQVGQ